MKLLLLIGFLFVVSLNLTQGIRLTGTAKVDGGWSTWSKYGDCSATCGDGTQKRTRSCNNPAPAYGGKNCASSSVESQSCNTKDCRVDGVWSTWENSICTVTCGGGTRWRERSCSNPAPAHGGNKCTGSSFKSQSCNTEPCPVDGVWSIWSKYGNCSVTCGGGTRWRFRSCNNPAPAKGGKTCAGSGVESQSCNTKACIVDGAWSNWSRYGDCSATCGGGTQKRTRSCNNPAPANGGKNCTGSSLDTHSCSTQACIVDGGWAAWSDYMGCSASCNGGTWWRYRDCVNPAPSNGGKKCAGSEKESQRCNTQPCPIDGRWSTWKNGDCTVTCGGGFRWRERSCNNPAPARGGKNCAGSNVKTQSCNTKVCPIDGGWAAWGQYDFCTATCGGGTEWRYRSCENPVPARGGKNCTGSNQETRRCATKPCP